jgi:hypothetical protein
MMKIPASPARWRRSTGRWREVSGLPGYSTICVAYRRDFADCGRAGGVTSILKILPRPNRRSGMNRSGKRRTHTRTAN